MSVIVIGGNIGFVVLYFGCVWGLMYEIFGWILVLEVLNFIVGYKGDDVFVEVIV